MLETRTVPRMHVVFDLDDTLYPERQFACAGFRGAGEWARSELGLDGLAADMERLLDAGHLGGLFRLALAGRIGGEPDPAHVMGLMTAYRNANVSGALALYDDAAWAIDHYGRLGPLGLITDGTHTMQRKKVTALGIGARFREIVYTDALGPGRRFFKPHPLAFERMAAALGEPGDRFVYVGDNPAKDFLAPNALGWLSVQVVRNRSIHDPSRIAKGGAPDHRITSLLELPAVIGH